ncbi:M6 family metalloprotease domain-containing protein [Streptomyces sp. HSW2009]|uniref:M6 family metalloprotease domain-containing protein n=1 Tax=Streptomyces sp. HSW2009 TaxID=3142890 RepID=UPI0032EC03A4
MAGHERIRAGRTPRVALLAAAAVAALMPAAPTAPEVTTATPPGRPPLPTEWETTEPNPADDQSQSHQAQADDGAATRRDEAAGRAADEADGTAARPDSDPTQNGRTARPPAPHRPQDATDAADAENTKATGASEAADDAADLPCALPTHGGAQLAEGIPTEGSYSRSTGTVRALTLMIDFPGTPGEGTAQRRFAEFFPQTSQWFARSSYGRLDYRPDTPIRHWLRMPHPFASYGIERGSPYEPGYRRLLDDLVAAADERVDFSRYDLVNVLVTPNAGPPAAQTVLSVTFAGNDSAPRADGVRLANVSFVYSRQDDGTGTLHETGYRVLPHENNHSFGLPDLYTASGAQHAGHWDLMSEDWGANNDVIGWHKWKLGWLKARQVACATKSPGATASPGTSRHTLSPLARAGGTKVVFLPVSPRGGYAMEARTREGNAAAVCQPGVLIYWVDVHKESGQGPVTVMDARRTTPLPRPGAPTPHTPTPPNAPTTRTTTGNTPANHLSHLTPYRSGLRPWNAPISEPRSCSQLPNVHADLSDATFTPGQTFHDNRHGVRVSIAITGHTRNGDYTIKITRRGSSA